MYRQYTSVTSEQKYILRIYSPFVTPMELIHIADTRTLKPGRSVNKTLFYSKARGGETWESLLYEGSFPHLSNKIWIERAWCVLIEMHACRQPWSFARLAECLLCFDILIRKRFEHK